MGQGEDPSDYLNRIAKHPRLSRNGGPSSMEQNGGRQKQLRALEDGNWICEDSSCGNINYPRRIECNKCGKKRGPLGDSVVKAYVDSLKIQRGEKGERGGERGELPFGATIFPSHEVKGQMSDHHQIGGILGRGILGEGGGGGGGGEIGGPPPQSSLSLPNMGEHEYWIGNSYESYQEKVFSHHPNYVSEQTLTSQYVAGEGGRRSTISAVNEGKRLAEQLVALFAASSDPIGDAGECLASAALWLQTMKARIQIPSSHESPIDSSTQVPSNPPSFGLNGPIIGLNTPSFGVNGPNVSLNTPNFGLNAPKVTYKGPTVVGNSPMGIPVNDLINNMHNNSVNNNPVNNLHNNLHNNLQNSRSLGVTGAQTIYGIPTKYSSGYSENPIWQNGVGGGIGGVGGGGVGGGGGGGGGGHATFTSHSSRSVLVTPVTSSNTGGRVVLSRPKVKFEDYEDRPSDYLREFGDPAAVNASGGGGSGNQRPEPGINGNWECEDCKNVNFPRRTNCFQCHKKRGPAGEEIVRNYVRKLIEWA